MGGGSSGEEGVSPALSPIGHDLLVEGPSRPNAHLLTQASSKQHGLAGGRSTLSAAAQARALRQAKQLEAAMEKGARRAALAAANSARHEKGRANPRPSRQQSLAPCMAEGLLTGLAEAC